MIAKARAAWEAGQGHQVMIVRVTGVIIEHGKILLLDQHANESRHWSLPGGAVQEGETLQAALVREMHEETGLHIRVADLLYVCDYFAKSSHVVHITFVCERIGGILGMIKHGMDSAPIRGVEFVPIFDLQARGFSACFKELALNDFPDRGSYMGLKENIGL
jgi:ADP-ribose pyrophosphatase YjhB (NUDIX family)